MKMMWIVYDVDMEEEVMEALEGAGVKVYTLWERVLGRGSRSEPKFGTHAWPSWNRALMVALEDSEARRLWEALRDLCQRPQGGIHAFVWSLEGMM